MYRSGTRLQKEEYNFVLHQGGAGDSIGQLPAIKYILDHHKQIIINLWGHDYMLPIFNTVFSEYKNIRINSLLNSSEYIQTLPTRSPYAHNVNNLACHITDHAFLTLVGRQVEDKYKNYLQMTPIDINRFKLVDKYVVVTTGYTSETRHWKPESVNATVEYIIERGYTPVFLGRSYTPSTEKHAIVGNFSSDYSRGLNLIDKTTLLEAHAIMAGAVVTIGVDNGLLHLSCMSQAPSIWGFTTVLPEHRLPYRNNIKGLYCDVIMPTTEELKCIGCQSQMSFPTGLDFKFCPYEDYKCLDLMNADKWIKALRGYLL